MTLLRALDDGEREQFLREANTAEAKGNLGETEALFLGEKPAVYFEHTPTTIINKIATASGFVCTGPYVYDPQAALRIMHAHPDTFGTPPPTPEEFFQRTEEEEIIDPGLRKGLGLLLGYPPAAVRHYKEMEKTEELYGLFARLAKTEPEAYGPIRNRFMKENDAHGLNWQLLFVRDRLQNYASVFHLEQQEVQRLQAMAREACAERRFGVYGVYWNDHGTSEESRKHTERLKLAFEASGILEVERAAREGSVRDNLGGLEAWIRRRFGAVCA